MEQQADAPKADPRYLTLEELYGTAEPPEDGPDPEYVADIHLRLMLALGEAGYSGRLTWAEIDKLITIVERYSYLANRMWWAVYISVGGKCPTCGLAHPRRPR